MATQVAYILTVSLAATGDARLIFVIGLNTDGFKLTAPNSLRVQCPRSKIWHTCSSSPRRPVTGWVFYLFVVFSPDTWNFVFSTGNLGLKGSQISRRKKIYGSVGAYTTRVQMFRVYF